MKVRPPNDLLLIDIFVVLLILCIVFVPGTVARIIFGLSFVLFFPGYALMAALFPGKAPGPASGPSGIDGVKRTALSFGLSIAATALIGLGLKNTSWGISLEPVLYSITTA